MEVNFGRFGLMKEQLSAANCADRVSRYRVLDTNKILVIQGMVDGDDLMHLPRHHSTLHEGSVRRHVAEIKLPNIFAEVLAGTVVANSFPSKPLAKLDEKEFLLWWVAATTSSTADVKNSFGSEFEGLQGAIFERWEIKKVNIKCK